MLVGYVVEKNGILSLSSAVVSLAGDTGTMQWKSAGFVAKLVIILNTDTLL